MWAVYLSGLLLHGIVAYVLNMYTFAVWRAQDVVRLVLLHKFP